MTIAEQLRDLAQRMIALAEQLETEQVPDIAVVEITQFERDEILHHLEEYRGRVSTRALNALKRAYEFGDVTWAPYTWDGLVDIIFSDRLPFRNFGIGSRLEWRDVLDPEHLRHD